MGYGLVHLVVRRNVQFSTKALHHSKFLLERKLPAQVLSFPQYCKDSDDKSKEEKGADKKIEKPKQEFSDGKSHINHIIEQAKRGKVSVDDVTSLGKRVVKEGQVKTFMQAPQTVQNVCIAGLIPMLAAPFLSLLTGNVCIVHAHVACGATILSFLGGSTWYEAISKNEVSYEKLGWTVLPPIIGWTSLILPLPLGMLCTSFGFCISLVHDIFLTSYPDWMKSLRLVLTIGAIISYVLMLPFYVIM